MLKFMRRIGLASLLIAWAAGPTLAQDANATITGSVSDEQGQVLPGATVTLTHEATKTTRTTVTGDRGEFRFPTLVSGAYTVKVEMQGFRTIEKRGNMLEPSSTLSVGTLKVPLGQFADVITVESSGTKVNVEESQHSGLITSSQMEQLQSKGRDVMNLIRAIPGVRYEDDNDSVGDSFGTIVPNVSGQRAHWNRVTVDGLNGNELSGTNRIGSAVNLDAISEVKVLLNTYKAEYGGTGGANIQIVSKGGSSEYKGSLYYFGRRTKANANTWENNLNGVERAPYNYNTYGFNIGGPAPWQKGNKNLFFYLSLEAPQLTTPKGGLRSYQLPTELERRGDFSQSFPYANPNAANAACGFKVCIVDPVSGQPLPGNIVPQNLINPSFQALMNLYPIPNKTDLTETGGRYNYVVQNVLRNPRQNHLLRFDWKPSEKDSFFLSARIHKSLQKGSEGTAGSSDWGFFDSTYDFADQSINFGHTRIFSSSVINELSMGVRRADEGFGADGDANANRTLRSTVGFTAGQFYPQLNTYGAIPNVTLGGASSTGVTDAEFTFDSRYGNTAHDYVGSIRDNVTLTHGAHTYKAGALFERVYNNEARGGTWMGSYDIANSSRSSNPFATGLTYSNMLMGVFNGYTENDSFRSTANRQNRVEWYVQDTWKASRRLTLDLGIRFLWYEPYHQASLSTSGFVPSRYVVGASPRLYTPTASGAIDPANPSNVKTPTAAFQGRFVPGSGDPANGMVSAGDTSYPNGFRDNQGIHPEPRVGLAWDVFGNGKTAIHTGFGLGHQGYLGGGSQGNLQGPPNFNQINVPNGLASQLLGAVGLTSPPSVNGLERDAKTPSSYNFSFGAQHEIGWGTVIDATYVGVLNRHTEMQVNYNYIPNGAKLAGSTVISTPVRDVQTRNPLVTSTTDPTGRALYPDQWLRPYFGFGDITIRENWGTANYNALQVQLNRRYIKGMQFGVAYTFSKALGIGDEDPARYDPRLPISQYYTPARHNQTHDFVANVTYDIPHLSKLINAAPVKFLFDNWQITGEYAMASGDWAGIVLSLSPGQDFTGGSNCDFGSTNSGYSGCSGGATAVMLKNPRKKGGDPLDPNNPWFDTTAFARPTADNLGNTPREVIQRPPINVLNSSLFKNFPLGKRRKIQLRLEAYNVLNHTQIRDVNRTATFDANGVQTNTNFGLAIRTGTATRPPRILQAQFRLTF
jgi:hypothetical protein